MQMLMLREKPAFCSSLSDSLQAMVITFFIRNCWPPSLVIFVILMLDICVVDAF